MSGIEFTKTVRLAVSGDVWLTKLETEIIDTPMFQRLRQIKQLGPSAWVYPTAVHTRFDHSIGVLAATDGIVDAIMSGRAHVRALAGHNAEDITDNQRKLARLYGLLHDISHAPFGHTLEDELQVFSSHDEFQEEGQVSPRLTVPLGPDSEIGKLIIKHEGRPFYDRFFDVVLHGKKGRLPVTEDGKQTFDEFVYHLVSNTVCADLIDYLQRDSYFCNLGLRAPVRVLNYLYVTDVGEGDARRRRVVIRLWKSFGSDGKGRARRDILTDLAGLLDSRYMLAERVYFHPAKLIVGTMIGRAALEAKRANQLDEIKLFSFGDDTFLDYLARLPQNADIADGDDENIAENAARASRLANDVINRRLYKRVKSYFAEDFSEGTDDHLPAKEELHEALSNAEDRAVHEDEIANIAGVRSGDVLIYLGPENMNMKVAEAIIDWRGHRKKLSELSVDDDPVLVERLASIQKSHKRLWSVDLLVHPSISAERREIIATTFEAKFLPRKDRHAKWFSVLTDVATSEPLDNHKHADVTAACRAAAKELAGKELSEIPAHGQLPRDWLVTLVKENLRPSSGEQ